MCSKMATVVRLPEAAQQIAAHLFDQCRLLIKKIADRLQQRLKPHALPQKFEIRKAHLPSHRPRHGSTQQAENRRPKANSADHPATDDIGRLFGVAANHPQMRDIAPAAGKQNLQPKNAGNADSALVFCNSRQKLD